MPVYCKCKNCGEDHSSPIGFGDKKSFKDPSNIIQDNSFQYLKTGRSAPYSKEDMFWRD